jgi:aspartokinase/homoserine dehydrogenase 1
LSAATQQTKANGYTEQEPRDYLSGIDVARRMLILAHEAGFDYRLEIADIKIELVLPSSINTSGYI